MLFDLVSTFRKIIRAVGLFANEMYVFVLYLDRETTSNH